MIKCPMCREMLPDDARVCRKCQTDLALLSDYTSHLRQGLSQAETSTRAGELGEAVWAYLAVLEVDPDNATARRQVGKVVTAVRQFDESAPGRRWAKKIHKEGRYRRWLASMEEGDSGWASIFSWVILFVLFFGGVLAAYYIGFNNGRQLAPEKMDKIQEERKEEPKVGEPKGAKGLGEK